LASIVVNVPYGGLFMPPAILKRLPLKPEELGWEHFRLADPCLLNVLARACEPATLEGRLGTKALPRRTLVSYAFSPLVADPLGFLAAEVAAGAGGAARKVGGPPGEGGGRGGAPEAGGGGPSPDPPPAGPAVIPVTTSGGPLFGWTEEEKAVVFRKSALPYLAEIRDRVRERLDRDSLVLLLTVRSYAGKPWNYERERRYPRPQLNIGSLDGWRTPIGLAEFIGRTFKTFGLWPELDWPHRSAYAPPELAGSRRLFCCSASFRRDLYMDEATGRLSAGFEGLVRILRTVFSLLEEELEQVVKVRYRRRHPPKPPSMVIKAAPRKRAT
jgi:hypothetical protein